MSANLINLDGDDGDGNGDDDEDDDDDDGEEEEEEEEEDDCDIADLIDSEYSHDLSNEDYDDDEENYEDIQNEIHLHKMLSLIDHLVLDETGSYWNENQIPLTAMLPGDLLREIRVWRKKFNKKKHNQESLSNQNAKEWNQKQPITMIDSKLIGYPVNSHAAKTLPKLIAVKNNAKHISERVSFVTNETIQRQESKQLTLPPLLLPQNRLGREFSAGKANHHFQSRIMIEKKVSFHMNSVGGGGGGGNNMANSYFLESTTSIKSSSSSSSQIPMQSSLNRINSLRNSLTSYNQDLGIRSRHLVTKLPNMNNKLIRLPTLNPNGQGNSNSINFNQDDDDDDDGT